MTLTCILFECHGSLNLDMLIQVDFEFLNFFEFFKTPRIVNYWYMAILLIIKTSISINQFVVNTLIKR